MRSRTNPTFRSLRLGQERSLLKQLKRLCLQHVYLLRQLHELLNRLYRGLLFLDGVGVDDHLGLRVERLIA